MPVPKVLSLVFTRIKKIQTLGNFINNKFKVDRKLMFIQNIMDISPNPTFYKDKEGICCYCNLAFEEYLGLKKEEIIGYPIFDISSSELVDVVLAADKRLNNNDDQQTYKTLFKSKDGFIYDMVFKKDINKAQGYIKGYGSKYDRYYRSNNI